MSNFKFKPSKQGFIDLRNESFVQSACLDKAREVAAIASGASGRAFSTNVQPGRSRCHAWAFCDVPIHPRSEWYAVPGAWTKAVEAATQAALVVGGSAGGYKKKGRK